MKVSLVVMNPGKTAGHAIPITLSQFIIGRDPQCNLRPASPIISKRHCAILIKNGKVTVRDFDSTNGTLVDDIPVKGEVPLNHDNILKIGPLTFKIAIEKSTPVDKPTPPPAPAKKKVANDEEDVGDMLLALHDDDEETSQNGQAESVPGGSTVMDMPGINSPPALGELPTVSGKTPPPPTVSDTEQPAKKPEEKKAEEKKSQHGNARDAAKAILDKYTRRRGG